MTMKESHVNIHQVPHVITCFLQDPEWGVIHHHPEG